MFRSIKRARGDRFFRRGTLQDAINVIISLKYVSQVVSRIRSRISLRLTQIHHSDVESFRKRNIGETLACSEMVPARTEYVQFVIKYAQLLLSL